MITLASLITIAIIFYGIVYFRTERRINKKYNVKLQSLTIPNDSLSYITGKHIAENRGCLGCHGNNLGSGKVFLDNSSPVGVLAASNITSGKGGIRYNDEDWIRVLRHGLNKNNQSVWFMPSHEVSHISNQEMAQLISYLKKQPPVDAEMPAKKIKPLGRVLTFFDQLPLLPAEMINHNAVYKDKIQPAVTAQYGGYLATSCKGCHGDNFKGAPAHGPSEPPIPDISLTGRPGKWKDDQFITALRTGKTPEGKHLSDAMPWKSFTYTNDELKAISLYLHELK